MTRKNWYRAPERDETHEARKTHILRWASLVFAVGLTMVAEIFFTVEWSTPACNDPQDGPVRAVFGAPLPYERFSGASSLQFNFMPHVYVLNILLLSGVAWVCIHAVARRVVPSAPRLVPSTMAVLGCLFSGAALALHVTTVVKQYWIPVTSVSNPPDESYFDMRPVGLTSLRHYDCTPSRFWFPARRAVSEPDGIGPNWRQGREPARFLPGGLRGRARLRYHLGPTTARRPGKRGGCSRVLSDEGKIGMRVLKVSLILVIALAFGCGGSPHPADAPAGGGSAGEAAADKPAKPRPEACNELLDHIQSVSSEAIDRAGMTDACLNQWPEAQINCFKAAGDDAAVEACWPAHK